MRFRHFKHQGHLMCKCINYDLFVLSLGNILAAMHGTKYLLKNPLSPKILQTHQAETMALETVLVLCKKIIKMCCSLSSPAHYDMKDVDTSLPVQEVFDIQKHHSITHSFSSPFLFRLYIVQCPLVIRRLYLSKRHELEIWIFSSEF